MFCHFRSGQHHFLPLSAKCMSLYKTAFSAGVQHVLTFLHWPHLFLAIFSKGHQFVQNSVFCPRSARFLIFALSAPLSKRVHEFVQDSVFSPRSARFLIFALGPTRFSFFQQSARVCTNQRSQPEICTYCHFCTGCTTL